MKHLLKLTIFGICLALTQTLSACEIKDPLEGFHWKKAKLSKEDCEAFYDLHESFRNSPNDRMKYLELPALGPRATFYEQCRKDEAKPNKGTVYFELNPLSGIYLFYVNPDPNPIGFIKVSATYQHGLLSEAIAVKEGYSGVGLKALQVLKAEIDQHQGKELMLCVKKKGTINTKHIFAKQVFTHVMAGIELDNTPSLISHSRVGMDPLFFHRKKNVYGAYLIYPPFDPSTVKREFPKDCVAYVEHNQEKLEQFKSILKQLDSKETREAAKKSLEEFKKEIK